MLNPEYFAAFGIDLSLAAKDVIENWVVVGRIQVDPFDCAALSVATVCGLVLRTLERHGGLRRVAGR